MLDPKREVSEAVDGTSIRVVGMGECEEMVHVLSCRAWHLLRALERLLTQKRNGGRTNRQEHTMLQHSLL